MSIKDLLKERALFFIINIFLFIITAIIMKLVNVSTVVVFIVFCIWFIPLISYVLIEFLQKKKYYNELINLVDDLDKKYLLIDIIEEAEFTEGKILYDILKDVTKDMHEHVKYYREMQSEYREYIESWVHEIKTPIASSKLIIENNPNNITNKIDNQLNNIEGFIEQVLYYSRSNDVSKDYIIKKFTLTTAVNNVLKRNFKEFIGKKIQLHINNIDKIVYSDAKWVEFILNQIIGNSIKYSKNTEPTLNISAIEKDNSIILEIEDNGVGIIDEDLNRVFEKGFTGENGRKFGKATGMGLYLSKKLCKKLGLGIELESKVNYGTKVSIIFPIGKMTDL